MTDVSIGRITVGLTAPPNLALADPAAPGLVPRRLDSAQAPTNAPFEFGLPLHLPAGFALIEALALEQPRRIVLLSYLSSDNAGRLTLLQAPVDQYATPPDGDGRYLVIGDSVAATTVGGLPAALVQVAAAGPGPGPINLIWENGSLLGHCMGVGVSADELRLIAESVPAVP